MRHLSVGTVENDINNIEWSFTLENSNVWQEVIEILTKNRIYRKTDNYIGVVEGKPITNGPYRKE